MFYEVKPQDTLGKIAQKNSVPLELLLAFNKDIKKPDNSFVGQRIYIPNIDDVPGGDLAIASLTASDLITRARSAVKKGIRYKLGEGGTNPAAELPDSGNLCDCSGFVCWVLELSRKTKLPFYQKYGGWIYTDSMVADVNSKAGIFEKLTVPEAGCIVVYGAGAQIGHVGIVSEVLHGKMRQVIHCSHGNDRTFGDSIQETGPAVFNRADALWGRFTKVA
jgi:hypothetical protein